MVIHRLALGLARRHDRAPSMRSRTSVVRLSLLALAVPAVAQNVGLRLSNGVDSYVDVPYDPTLVPRSGITVEAWITYDDASLGTGWRWPTIVRQNSTPQVVNYMLRVEAATTSSTVLGWSVRTAAGVRSTTWSFAPGQLTSWTHVAATYDGTSLRLYVNGQPVSSAPHSGAIVDTADTLRIGNGDLSAPGIEEWNGDIDELRLWPFARTGAEILSTMNLELGGVPGEVSTWSFNGSLQDTSNMNHGQPVNGPTLTGNTLTLTPVPALGAASFGTATAGCSGLPRAVVTARPRVGNVDFGVGAIRATATGQGILWLGTQPLASPIRFLGVDLWLDPLAPSVQVAAAGGGLGFARVPLPIPSSASLRNRTLVFQTVWAQSGCATPLFSSDGLGFVIAP